MTTKGDGERRLKAVVEGGGGDRLNRLLKNGFGSRF
jgi:hypothetical protein